ncbi:MAG TPA: nitrilase-related carbon-nitrogen hydrolase [Anaerolineales bacterium]|nr:nitrilase-related carbon-nitrogen hydrolase [Anaerolineales bacterium]
MNANKITYPQNDRWSYLWLLIATALGIFSLSVGKWIIPITAWLGGIFMIRFFRTQKRVWLAYLLAGISTAVVTAVAMPSFMSSLAIPVIVGAAILSGLPLVADRLLAPRLPGFASTLVFPLAMTALEYINVATNPLGSTGASAYSQFDNLVLLQLVSLTGMWGISFLMSWLATVVNWAWEREFAWPVIKRGTLIYLGVMLLVVAYGQVRLWFAQPPADTVRVAGFTLVEWRAKQPEMNQAFATDIEAFRQMMEERYQLYFDATVREARAGAKIILWPENSATVAKDDEPALLARAQDVAKQEGIYLALPMIVQPRDDSPYANKLVVFDPQGQMVLEHYKYGGVGFEGNRINGDGVLHTAQTPFGVISGVICWDTDFPAAVLQSGRNGTDILLSPSLEFREYDPIHAHMAVMRAIENGVSVVRVADMGLSVVVDPYGRILAATDHFTAGERTIIAQVPTKGVWTLYPIIGDLFAWLSIVGFVGMTVWAVIRTRGTARRLVANPGWASTDKSMP